MASIRQNKVSNLIKKELGNLFQREVRSIFGGAFVTVTSVRVTPDLSIAKVYLSLFLPKEQQETLFERISQAKGKIRQALGNKIRNQVRMVPDLHFYIDDSFDYAERIDKLLKDDKPDETE